VLRAGIERLLLLRRSLFVRQASILSLGQLAAAGIAILGAMVLGRLYTPAEYGMLGAYMALTSVLSSIGNWQFSVAVVIEASNRKAYALVRLCLFTSLITAAIAALIAGAMLLYPFGPPEWRQAAQWIVFLPMTVLGAGLVGAWSALANRRQSYRFMALSQASTALLTVVMSIAFGLAGYGAEGLMISYLIGQAYLFSAHILYFLGVRDRPRRFSARRLLAVGKRHRKFALWTMPSTFVGNFFMQSPIFALGVIGAPALIGAFNRGRMLLIMPTQLVGNAVGQVFRQRAAVEVATNGHCLPLFNKAFLGLLLLGAPPIAFLMVFAPALMTLYLGPDWRIAGDVARILAPMLLLELICAPIATVFVIRGRQTEDFILQTVFGAITGALVLTPVLLGASPITVIYAYAFGQSLLYGWYIVRSRQLAGPQT
jgi:O-antigen/teichoic acid export membrane protein